MIKKIFILANKKIPGIDRKVLSLDKLLKSCGKEVKTSAEDVDLIIALGGDGTLIKGVHMLEKRALIYGIKYGKLGFLTNSPQDADKKIRKILKGEYSVTRRMLLDVSVKRNGRTLSKNICLNEAVIHRKGIRIININVSGSREPIFRIRGDGLIISTPTGSTAHSLSALGPVADPELKCMILLPVCPHTLSWRPVILRDSERISVEMAQDGILILDGQKELPLAQGDTVSIKKSPRTADTIMDDKLFFRNLESKFSWNR